MDRPRHEYEQLQVLKFCKGPEDLRSEIAFCAAKERLFRKDYIVRKFFIISKNSFWNIFLT
jgi:hypothetical protein